MISSPSLISELAALLLLLWNKDAGRHGHCSSIVSFIFWGRPFVEDNDQEKKTSAINVSWTYHIGLFVSFIISKFLIALAFCERRTGHRSYGKKLPIMKIDVEMPMRLTFTIMLLAIYIR